MGHPAARVGDEVAHSNAMMGLLIGAAIGAALAVAVVATGGLAAVAAGAMLAGGLAGGALAGEYIGAASMGPPTGAIMIGSTNVIINGRPAAMTNIAMAICAKEYGVPQPIAQGAATILINGMPAARQNDKLTCGGMIIQGSPDVIFDDQTKTMLPIADEVPPWLNRTLEVVALGAAVVGFGAAIVAVGFGAACAGLAGGLVVGQLGSMGGRALGQALGLSEAGQRSLEVGGGILGGMLGGGAATKAYEGFGANAEGAASASAAETCTGGEPISMLTGEELLALEDFAWEGPLTLVWRRFYRTAQSAIDLQLGHGWVTPLDEWIERDDDNGLVFHDREGRRIRLPLPVVGGHGVNPAERLRVERSATHVRVREDGLPDRLFVLGRGRSSLVAWRQAGHQIDLVRDDAGRVTALRSSWGAGLLVERIGHRIAALVPAHTRPDGLLEASGAPFVRYAYDDAGDLVGHVNRLDQGERYRYVGHLLSRRTLASGFSYHFEWDGAGPGARCVRSRGDNGIYDTRFEWAPEHGWSRAIDSRGGATEYVHDTEGRVVRITSAEGVVEIFAYDDRGLLRERSGPNGPIVRYDRDLEGRVVTSIDAEGSVRHFAYDPFGRLARTQDALGGTTAWQYDGEGRVVQMCDAGGGITAWTYNAQGLLAQVRNAVGQVRRLWWDEHARLVAEIGSDGVRRHFEHDADGRICRAVVQDGPEQRYEWNPIGQLLATTDESGRTIRLRRDGAGRVTHWIGADGATTEFRYRDGLSQPTERIDPLGHTLRYEYDTQRNLIGLVNPKGERVRLEWDLDEQLILQTGFDGRTQRYGYDAAGQLAWNADATGDGTSWAVTHLKRNQRGQLLSKTTPDGTTHDFAYDAVGRLVEARTPEHTVGLTYDALGGVIEERQGDSVVRHQRDAIGRRIATQLPDGHRLGYAWNRNGKIEQIDLDGQPVTQHRWDGFAREAERDQGDATTRFTYDPAGRLASQSVQRRADGERVVERSYDRDVNGRLACVHDLRHGDTRYVYDPAGQLVDAHGLSMERFVHDPAGNLLGAGNSVVEGNRLLVQGDRHFRYDAAGNLVEERRGTGGRLVTHYDYDGSHRLVAAHTPRDTTRYRYDALGRRIAKVSDERETRFWWDGVALLGEESTEGLNTSRRWYVYEPGTFRPLARIDVASEATARPRLATVDGALTPLGKPGTQVYHYHVDHLGTPREMTDADGRVVWSARYRAFGALVVADVAEIDNPLRFQGQYHDVETGLHYNFLRYCDPTTGRYLSQDPIGLEGGINAYRYVSDPVQWIDPLGLVGTCKDPDVVYRVIRPDEDPAAGLTAKNPDANWSPTGHVNNGSRPGAASQFISTTRDPAVAEKWSAATGNRIVSIDLSKVNGDVLDLSTAAGRDTYLNGVMAKNFAGSSSEVLVKGSIPPEAISPYPGP